MKKRSGTLIAALLFCAALVLTVVGCSTEEQVEPGSVDSPVAGEKVAYIMQMASSEIFETWAQSAVETAERLGMEADVYFCDGSDSKWKETVRQCAADGYDGLLLSHGGKNYSYDCLTEVLEAYPELKIVTFDTLFENSIGETQKIDGVTQFFQQDSQLAVELLDYICNTLYPEKAAAGEPVQILKVWVGPGYLSAFDRREVGYAAYEQQGLIHTVDTIGPSDYTNVETSMAEVTAAALEAYDGEIDAIWCCYDLYASGVYLGLQQGGSEIPLVSVDISNSDIEKMAAEASPWKACATTNWSYNGEFGMRVLALELADQYDQIIDPTTGEASDWLELPTSLITQDMVAGGSIDVSNLDTVAGAQYSDRSWMVTSDWMAALLGD